jgi:LuxR family maltose regulon positive regulatory protein
VLAAKGRHSEASSLLDRLLRSAQADGRDGSAIGILVLQAMFERAQGNRTRACERLEHALILADPEGFVRIFVDEGEPMHKFLLDYQSTIKKQISIDIERDPIRLLTYIDRLLAAFSQPAPVEKPKKDSVPEPLSERELDILQLIATGRTNQEIADILIIALSTVKSHINNLYGKLGTQRRTQAISIARDLGLLEERNLRT